jgi:hypothetical protein
LYFSASVTIRSISSLLKRPEKIKIHFKWLDANNLAEKDEFEHKQKELEGICNPIVTKLYQAAGGAGGGMPPGGMPNFGGAGGPGGPGGAGSYVLFVFHRLPCISQHR